MTSTREQQFSLVKLIALAVLDEAQTYDFMLMSFSESPSRSHCLLSGRLYSWFSFVFNTGLLAQLLNVVGWDGVMLIV